MTLISQVNKKGSITIKSSKSRSSPLSRITLDSLIGHFNCINGIVTRPNKF